MALNGASLTLAACLVSLLAGSAMADDERGNPNAFLKGTYRLNSNASCTSSDAGFDGLKSLGPGQTDHIYLTGVITYDGNGHATQTDHGIFLSGVPHGANTFPVGTFEETCDWTYAVNRDRSFSQVGSCTATDGSTLTGLEFVGQIGVGRSVSITNQVEPVVQTLTIKITGSPDIIIYRICGAAGTQVRIRHPE